MNKIHHTESDSLFNWDKLYSINPKQIKWALTTNSWFDVCKNEWYKIYDGDWDKKLKIEKDFVYSSIYDMFKNHVPFKQTPLYITSLNQISQGQNRWCCTTQQEFAWREGHIRDCFSSLNTYGFKTQDELEQMGYMTVKLNNKNVDDPGVILDRDGRYLYHNANHRLPMFHVLNIPEIKIKVNVRHKEWVDFLQYFNNVSKSIWGENKIYQPIDHVDFINYKSEWSDYRFNVINKEMWKCYNTVLDIGALFGYFSLKFSEQGFKCTAVETNKDFVTIMKKFQSTFDQDFTIIEDDIFNLQDLNYDVVLALNIFHHFLKKEETFNKLTTFLQKLNIKEMYFQTHQTNEPQMQGAYKNFESIEFVNYIINNSCLTNYKEIGEELGRKIYKLWR